MNVHEMCKEVNVMLARMDEQCAQVQTAFGVRPDLEKAKEAVNVAGTTVMELGTLLAQMQELGFQHPPDVIQRVRERYHGLHRTAFEIAECEKLVFARSRSGRSPKTLN
jgi:hypothetical protein